MSALVSALDNSLQYGGNAHLEYKWSTDIRERILQFSFQLTRTTPDIIEHLANNLRDILRVLKADSTNIVEAERQEFIITLSKMTAQTRDIIAGKGEYALSYMMILVWYEFFPELATFLLNSFVLPLENNPDPFGSWKDIKYLCNYCRQKQNNALIEYCVNLLNTQIRKDYENMTVNAVNVTISLAGKWVPRETSNKFGWLFCQLAYNYFPHYLASVKNPASMAKAELKCLMEYRKIITKLNRHVDTVQIKQCAHDWKSIIHSKTTSITITKQKQAFLNCKKDGTTRTTLDDRIICAANFRLHVENAVFNKTEVKGQRVGLHDFTKEAMKLNKYRNCYLQPDELANIQLQLDLLNSQWRSSSSLTSPLRKMIAMVDLSGSMQGDPLYSAIALGCRVAEKSIVGKRVMTFSASPQWVNLDKCETFADMVEVIAAAPFGLNTNFYAALDMILQAIIDAKLSPEDVVDMTLAIFSDMQIDDAIGTNTEAMYKSIEQKYKEAGMRLHGQPFMPPHILFWNLRSTSGFPTLSTQLGASMMSGFSPALLNVFCEQGITALQTATPWSMLMKSLGHTRYTLLEEVWQKTSLGNEG